MGCANVPASAMGACVAGVAGAKLAMAAMKAFEASAGAAGSTTLVPPWPSLDTVKVEVR